MTLCLILTEIMRGLLLIFIFSGEHIKNWRQRYFILKEDGQFIGFKSKPSSQDLNDPLNNFTVKGEVEQPGVIPAITVHIPGCQIMTAEKPKPHTFFIRGLQMTTVVERMFHVDSAQERAGWLEAIERVKKKLDETKVGLVGVVIIIIYDPCYYLFTLA